MLIRILSQEADTEIHGIAEETIVICAIVVVSFGVWILCASAWAEI